MATLPSPLPPGHVHASACSACPPSEEPSLGGGPLALGCSVSVPLPLGPQPGRDSVQRPPPSRPALLRPGRGCRAQGRLHSQGDGLLMLRDERTRDREAGRRGRSRDLPPVALRAGLLRCDIMAEPRSCGCLPLNAKGLTLPQQAWLSVGLCLRASNLHLQVRGQQDGVPAAASRV